VLWSGAQKHKGLDGLVPSTCEEPAYRVPTALPSQGVASSLHGRVIEAVLST